MHKYKLTIFICFLFLTNFSSYANDENSLSELKSQLKNLQHKIENLEKAQKKIETEKAISNNQKSEKDSDQTIKLYATLRPTFGYINQNDENSWDVKDALSHVGIKATKKFDVNWSAEMQGEWGIDLSNNGDFGKARQVYVALNSPIGRIGIGKQRPTQYLFIAEYVDIFNHGNSPFAYDPESIFFIDNLITYQLQFNNFNFIAVGQFNGDVGDNNSDLFNIGISYDLDGLHAAATYLVEDTNETGFKVGENEIFAASLAYSFDNLYLAASYQDKLYKVDHSVFERDGYTLDISAAYKLTSDHKLKLGYFDFSDGIKFSNSQDHYGYNATLEWSPSDSLRFHLEYLFRNYDFTHDFSSWSIGFRYDLAHKWNY